MSVGGAKLDRLMRIITGLLAKADDSATTPEESDSCRAQAENLMQKYRIEESTLAAQGGVENRIQPMSREVPLCPWSSPYVNTYWAIMYYVAEHVGVRMAQGSEFDENGIHHLTAHLVGFESDLRFAEALYQSARIIFADRMEPKPNPYLSDEENVYRMRSAGMERIKVARLMGWEKGGAKVTRLYKAACAARGEEPMLTGRDVSVSVFREEYAKGFQRELAARFRRARTAADATSSEGALVLSSRKDEVDETFYKMFPHLRPSDLPAKTTGKVRSRRWTKADEQRWMRSQGKAGQMGQASGRSAASEVSIDGNKPPTRLN